MTAGEIRALVADAGFAPGDCVLDMCSGAGGPAGLVAGEFGCRVTGVDEDAAALGLARRRALAGGYPDRLRCVRGAADALPVRGPLAGVLLFETLLAFPEKAPVLAEIARVLRPGGRFAGTLEDGRPLSPEERQAMPAGDTVHILSEADFRALAREAGFREVQIADHTAAHAEVARCLTAAYQADQHAIARGLGADFCRNLVRSHALWVEWLESRRVRKLAFVFERTD